MACLHEYVQISSCIIHRHYDDMTPSVLHPASLIGESPCVSLCGPGHQCLIFEAPKIYGWKSVVPSIPYVCTPAVSILGYRIVFMQTSINLLSLEVELKCCIAVGSPMTRYALLSAEEGMSRHNGLHGT
jgi:hypothetical protein